MCGSKPQLPEVGVFSTECFSETVVVGGIEVEGLIVGDDEQGGSLAESLKEVCRHEQFGAGDGLFPWDTETCDSGDWCPNAMFVTGGGECTASDPMSDEVFFMIKSCIRIYIYTSPYTFIVIIDESIIFVIIMIR